MSPWKLVALNSQKAASRHLIFYFSHLAALLITGPLPSPRFISLEIFISWMTVLNIHFTKVLLLKECCMSTNPNLWHCLWKKINVNDRKWFFIMTVTINVLWYLDPMSLNLCEKQTIVRSSSIFFLTWILFYSCGCAS